MNLFILVLTPFVLYLLQGILEQKYWNKNLSASVTFQDTPCVCGGEGSLQETVVNAKLLPLSILRVKFKIGRALKFVTEENTAVTDYTYRNDVFSVFPYQKITRTLKFVCEKRGYYELNSLDLVSHDLFFTGHMVESVPLFSHLYVYPSGADLERLNIPFQKMVGTVLSRNRLCRDPFEFQTIREYQTYDTMRMVNWKATARTRELKVNVQEPTASQSILIFLNMDSETAWASEALREEAISICGSLASAFIREGIPVGIISNGTDCLTGRPIDVKPGAGPEHETCCMETLSRLGYDTALLPMEEMIREQNRGKEDALFVMISSCQRRALSEAYEEYCRMSPGSVWIAPLRPEDELKEDGCPSAMWLKWEVSYDKV